jgi:TM2 domain-containing membrane protein YozV
VADDAHVLLCTCRDAGELQMLRAALEARGVPLRIEGATTHGMLGMIHGAGLAPRVLVPPVWRPMARQIAAEIVGPFEDEEQDGGPRAVAGTPFRGLSPEAEPEADDHDHDHDHDHDPVGGLARRNVAVPLMLAVFGLPWGLGHIYAGRPRRGVALMVVALGAAGLWFSGVSIAWVVLVAVGLADLAGSIALIQGDHRDRR